MVDSDNWRIGIPWESKNQVSKSYERVTGA